MTLPHHPKLLARRAALLLLLLLLLLACLPLAAPQHPCAAAPAEEVRELRLRQPRWSDLICIGVQRIRYQLRGLQRNTPYEVRISYPATNPVCVVLQLEAAAADSGRGSGSGKTGTRRSSRRLLDAEKVMFRTDNFGRVRVPGGSAAAEVDVLFAAERLVLYRGGEAAAPRQLEYDIVLEESYWGVPRSALPLLLTAAGAVAVVLALVPWWTRTAVPALLQWLAAGRSEKDPRGSKRRH